MTTRRINRLSLSEVRPLGAQFTFVEYEWLPSLFRRIGHAFDTSAEDITNACGLYDLSQISLARLPHRLHEDAVRGIGTAMGFTQNQLETTVMGYLPKNVVSLTQSGAPLQSKDWSRGKGTRFCVECLREQPGVFYTYWRLWWSFICTRHHTLLRTGCSSCYQDITEASFREQYTRDPSLCWASYPDGSFCQQELTKTWEEDSVQPSSPMLQAQFVIARSWDQPPKRLPEVDLRTLRGVSIALLGSRNIPRVAKLARIPEEQLAGILELEHTRGGMPPKEPLAMAALLGAAYRLVTGPERAVRAAIRETNFIRPVKSAEPVEGPGSGRYLLSFWPGIDEQMRGRVLRALDPDLPTIQRLVHGSPASAEAFESYRRHQSRKIPDYELPLAELEKLLDHPHGDVNWRWADRMVPKLMWPTWAAPLGINENTDYLTLQSALADALRVAGTALKPDAALISGLGRRLRPTMLGNRSQTKSVLRQLCELALKMRVEPGPIDYASRGSMPIDQLLLEEHWQMLTLSVRENAGAGRRILNAKRYAMLRVSGIAPQDLPTELRFRTNASDVDDYTQFILTMSAEFKAALDEYLKSWLHRFEPLSKEGVPQVDRPEIHVTYDPPRFTHSRAQLAPELDDIDLAALHEMVGNGVRSLRKLADAVGRSVRHVRWAIAEHPVSHGQLIQAVNWDLEMAKLPESLGGVAGVASSRVMAWKDSMEWPDQKMNDSPVANIKD